MTEGLIYLVLIAFFILIVLMLIRMQNLYKKSVYDSGQFKYAYKDQPDLLAFSKRFVAEELLEVKPKASYLTQEADRLYNEAISYYLIGFVEDLSNYFSLEDTDKQALMMALLKSALDLSPIQMIQLTSNVAKVHETSLVAELVNVGGIAFYAWVEKKSVPLSISMKVQVNNYVLSCKRDTITPAAIAV